MKPIDIAFWEEEPTGSVSKDSPLLGDLALTLSFCHPGLLDPDLLRHVKVFAGRFYSLRGLRPARSVDTLAGVVEQAASRHRTGAGDHGHRLRRFSRLQREQRPAGHDNEARF
jgi:hypothetical protein